MDTSKSQLRLEQVSLYARLQNQQGYPILQDISFEVSHGDRLAIVGPTGAGKTFLLRLLNRLSEPSRGKIYFQDRPYDQIPVVELRQQVVFVPQHPKLLGMSVKEALAYPLVLRGVPKQTVAQRLAEWIEKLRIPDEWLGRTEVQLSSGEKQLVAIARALLIQPPVLLLDAPTSTLDVGTATHVLAILLQLAQFHQTTILISDRSSDLAEEFCSHLLHLQQGRLLANHPAAQINWNDLRQSLKKASDEDDFGF